MSDCKSIRDGAVLSILHLNGYKIDNPTILARVSHEELEHLFQGYGYPPYFVEGDDHESMHQAIAATLEHCIREIQAIQQEARNTGVAARLRWPVRYTANGVNRSQTALIALYLLPD